MVGCGCGRRVHSGATLQPRPLNPYLATEGKRSRKQGVSYRSEGSQAFSLESQVEEQRVRWMHARVYA